MRRAAALVTVVAVLVVTELDSSAATAPQSFGPTYASAWSDPCASEREPVDPIGVTVMKGCSWASTSGALANSLAWRVLGAGNAYGRRAAVGLVPLAQGTEHAFRIRVTAQVSGHVTITGLGAARMGLQLVMGAGAPCNRRDNDCVLIPTRGEQAGVYDAYYTGGGMQMGVESVLASVTPTQPSASVSRTVVLTARLEDYHSRWLAAGSYPLAVRIGSQMHSGALECEVHALDGCFGPVITPTTGNLSLTARILSVTVTPTSYRSLSPN